LAGKNAKKKSRDEVKTAFMGGELYWKGGAIGNIRKRRVSTRGGKAGAKMLSFGGAAGEPRAWGNGKVV